VEDVEKYFQTNKAASSLPSPKIRHTNRPPIYLQTPSKSCNPRPCKLQTSPHLITKQPPEHAMVVIGIEKHPDGQATLLVLDPKYHDTDLNAHLYSRPRRPGKTDEWLSLYRRNASYLKRHSEFEMIMYVHQRAQGHHQPWTTRALTDGFSPASGLTPT
jgi:hypothetical protein